MIMQLVSVINTDAWIGVDSSMEAVIKMMEQFNMKQYHFDLSSN